MEILRFDLNKTLGEFKIMHATNGGPIFNRFSKNQFRSNLDAYQKVKFPYTRNHDAAHIHSYGGYHSHDITGIFPNFDADPEDPAAYDFDNTDEDIEKCLIAGTKTFYRLGQSIEHTKKKHGTIPPKDFKKWAVICEHVILHYTKGWADGFNYDMPYWEIWNEPDLDPEEATHRRTWGGTTSEFYDFFETVAKHLKEKFPHLKIGGPALAHRLDWGEAFVKEMKKRNVPMDFFSWHIYYNEPKFIVEKGKMIRDMLDKYGYRQTESILDEWNYIRGWSEEFVYSLEAIHGIKGAAFVMSTMCECQKSSIDMLFYYDTRPSTFNGVFDYYTLRPLKTYYAFYWYSMLYQLKAEVRSENTIDDIYSLCGVDENGKAMSVITYYTEREEIAKNKSVGIDFGKIGEYELYLLDESCDAELIKTTNKLEFDMKPNSIILIIEK